jgi:hypothetical protein
MSYWDETDQYLHRHGGRAPACPRCGKEMFPEDDHGRFKCLCNLRQSFDVVTGTTVHARRIPQVDVSGMTDEQKAQVPPVNRLHDTPTAAEAKLFSLSAKGPDSIGTPEYLAACKALKEERGQ